MTSFPRACVVACFFALVVGTAVHAEESWYPTNLADTAARCVAVSPSDSLMLLAGGQYLNVSHDGGDTWTTITEAGQIWTVAFGSDSTTAFAGGWGSGVFYSGDGGYTWVPSNTGISNGVIKAIAVSPFEDVVVFAGAENGIYRSTDGGATWTQMHSGFNVSAIALSPRDPNRMMLGTWSAGLWDSVDGGLTWSLIAGTGLPDGGVCYALAYDPADDAIIYATFQGGGVWRTFDDGATWEQITPGFEGFGVAVDPARPGFVYGLGGWTRPQRSGCYGAAYGWRGMSTSWSTSWFARGIAVDPSIPGRVYACGTQGGLLRWDSDATPPEPATNLVAGDTGGIVSLVWDASPSSDCSGYWVYRWLAGDTPSLVPFATVTGRTNTTYGDTSAEAEVPYAYAVVAVDAAENSSTPTDTAYATVAASYELDVTHIARLPRDTFRYQPQYPDGLPTLPAGTEDDKRWPELGETVTFVAYVKNKGTAATPPCAYRWSINGVPVSSGLIGAVAARDTASVELYWVWNVADTGFDHTDQTVAFEIDPTNQVSETFETNNTLTDYIEAMSLDIYVDQAIYDAFDATENFTGTYGFEDWIQAQIAAMNDNFARSTYPLAPDGCLERVRIDRIIIGPAPGDTDLVADGRWQFSGDPAYAGYANRVDNGLVHELMHQIGVIDIYQMPVTPTHNAVVTPDGWPVNMGFAFGRPGIMAGGDITPHTSGMTQYTPEYCSSHSVLGLNSSVGYRRGYYGEYLFDIPAENRIIVHDSAGQPAPGVTVRVYQGGFGAMDGTAVSEGVTDAQGMLVLPNREPVRTTTTATGHTLAANPFGTINVVGGNATLLLEFARPGGDFDYRFFNIIEFNEAFWGGATSQWTKTFETRLAANELARCATISAALEQSSVHLVWSAVPGAVGYRVYRASSALNRTDDPNHQYENYVFRPLATVTDLEYTDTARYQTSLYAVAPVAADDTEGPLSTRVFAPQLINPWGVALLPNGERVVLDPQNGFAFLRQSPAGLFISNTGSEHNHVEFSRFIAVDAPRQRLLTSHPTDYYGGPHSIRVTDYEGSLEGLYDIGVYGAGPGQFNDPAGVAVDADGRIYVADRGNNRVQVLDVDGDFLTQLGGSGAGAGQFNAPEGIAVSPDHRVYVCDRGNQRVQILQFDPMNGTLTFVDMLAGVSLQYPVGVAVAADGTVYVSERSRDTVEEFNAAGQWVRRLSTALYPASGAFNDPAGVAVDVRGRVIVCDTGNRRVVLAYAPEIVGDLNGDHYVNAADLRVFDECMQGPDVAPTTGCASADLDADTDVDLSDLAELQTLIDD